MNQQFKKIISPIEIELEQFEKYFKDIMHSDKRLLNIVLTYILKNKGKQFRPILVFLTAKLCGTVNDKTFVSAALIELLHTASLVHDDVVDNSQLRRGVFSVKALWNSKLAVLVGDFLLSKGLLLSVQNKAYDMLEIVSKAVKDMAEGELYQIEKTRRLNLSIEDYFKIIEMKTASLLIAGAVSGAKSVTENKELLNIILEFGKNLGIAFQIKDDLLDYQSTTLIGKPVGNDIQESKLTLPLIYSLKNASKKDNNKIKSILRKKKKSNSEIQIVQDFVRMTGGIKYSEEILKTYWKNAKELIIKNFDDNNVKESVICLIDYVVERNK